MKSKPEIRFSFLDKAYQNRVKHIASLPEVAEPPGLTREMHQRFLATQISKQSDGTYTSPLSVGSAENTGQLESDLYRGSVSFRGRDKAAIQQFLGAEPGVYRLDALIADLNTADFTKAQTTLIQRTISQGLGSLLGSLSTSDDGGKQLQVSQASTQASGRVDIQVEPVGNKAAIRYIVTYQPVYRGSGIEGDIALSGCVCITGIITEADAAAISPTTTLEAITSSNQILKRFMSSHYTDPNKTVLEMASLGSAVEEDFYPLCEALGIDPQRSVVFISDWYDEMERQQIPAESQAEADEISDGINLLPLPITSNMTEQMQNWLTQKMQGQDPAQQMMGAVASGLLDVAATADTSYENKMEQTNARVRKLTHAEPSVSYVARGFIAGAVLGAGTVGGWAIAVGGVIGAVLIPGVGAVPGAALGALVAGTVTLLSMGIGKWVSKRQSQKLKLYQAAYTNEAAVDGCWKDLKLANEKEPELQQELLSQAQPSQLQTGLRSDASMAELEQARRPSTDSSGSTHSSSDPSSAPSYEPLWKPVLSVEPSDKPSTVLTLESSQVGV